MRVQRVSQDKNNKENPEIDIRLIDPVIDKNKNKKGNLIPILQEVQEIYGYLPREAFDEIEKQTGISKSDMYGVASFYTQFRLKPVGKYVIKVCQGTACHVQNSKEITRELEEVLNIKDGETTPDNQITLESVACLGCCSLAPVLMVGDETYSKLTPKLSRKIAKEYKNKK